jgi:hypothetical protein
VQTRLEDVLLARNSAPIAGLSANGSVGLRAALRADG